MIRLANKRGELGVELPSRLVNVHLRCREGASVHGEHRAEEARLDGILGHARAVARHLLPVA